MTSEKTKELIRREARQMAIRRAHLKMCDPTTPPKPLGKLTADMVGHKARTVEVTLCR